MDQTAVKVAVTGAAGQIGYALLFRIASGEMFGKNTPVELSLLEVEPAMNALKGVVMELEDCAFPLLKNVKVSYRAEEAFEDIDWAILVGAVPRKAGMERGDLLKINAGVFIAQGNALSKTAKKECRVLVVGNPCNTNAFIAKENAKNLNPKNFFAMTMLDQNRACAQLAMKAGVDIGAIKNLAIWGNHSATQFPDFFHASINDSPATEMIKDQAWLEQTFIDTVQKRGAEIIKARGLSSAASAANAIINTIQNLTTQTPKNEFFSVATLSDGSYGVPEGLICGFPVSSDGKNWEIVKGIKHSPIANDKISKSVSELIEEKDKIC